MTTAELAAKHEEHLAKADKFSDMIDEALLSYEGNEEIIYFSQYKDAAMFSTIANAHATLALLYWQKMGD
jgi:hypothetical protein